MKRVRLSGKDVKEYNNKLHSEFSLSDFLDKKDNVELIDGKYLSVNGEMKLFYHGERVLPTLKLVHEKKMLPEVVIDMPAVPFIAKGADVMRPGIKEIPEFSQGAIVAVVDERNRKAIAVCEALFGSAEMKTMEKGKVLKNLHYVGDEIWKGEIGKRENDKKDTQKRDDSTKDSG